MTIYTIDDVQYDFDLRGVPVADSMVLFYCPSCKFPHLLFLNENGDPMLLTTINPEIGGEIAKCNWKGETTQ